MRKIICASLLSIFTYNVYAAIDCQKPIERIYAGHDVLFVMHGNGYSWSRMRIDYVDNDQEVLNRTLSMMLTAKASGETLIFRYTEGIDGSPASCTNNIKQKFVGVWIKY